MEIITREQWGARAPTSTLYSYSPSYIVWHHTYSPGCGVFSVETEASLQRQMQASHISRGWGDIGQHFTVFQSGRIFEARRLDRRGVHAAGFNSRSVGIEHQGDFHTDSGCWPTAEQVESSAKLCAYIFQHFGWDADPSRIIPHRAVTSTACPGNRGVQVVDQVRRKMLDYLKGEDEMSNTVERFRVDAQNPFESQVYLGPAYGKRYTAWLHLWRIGDWPAKVHVALYDLRKPVTKVEDAAWRGWVILDGVAGRDVELIDLSKVKVGYNYLLHVTALEGQPSVGGKLEILVV